MSDDIAGTGALTPRDRHSAVQAASIAVAALFLLVGVLGFIPGLVTDHGQLQAAGHESEAKLFGLFQVSVLHNAVHLAFGLIGLAMSRSEGTARAYLIGGGLVYAALFVYGLVVDQHSEANFVPLNDADNWLHLGLAIGMVGLGILLPGRRQDRVNEPLPPRGT